MNLRPLWKVIIIVLALSIFGGYWTSVSPYLTLMLHDAGYSLDDIGRFFIHLTILNLVVGYGGAILSLVASYYSGKKYKLTKISTLIFFILLVVAVWAGHLIGYVIRQIELPQYPILNINFIFNTLGSMNTILWSFVGMLAGNYKREVEEKARVFEKEQ